MDESNENQEQEWREPPGIEALRRLFTPAAVDGVWGTHAADNIILKIPELRLPQFRRTMLLFRILLAAVVVIKIPTILAPGAHLLLLVGDLLIGSTVFVVIVMEATRGHARDLRDKFQLDQLLAMPQGPQLLAQALFLRPFGDVIHLVRVYYYFSMICLCLNCLVTMILFIESGVVVAALFLLAIIATFQGPWILIIISVLVSSSIRILCAVASGEGNLASAVIANLLSILGALVLFGVFVGVAWFFCYIMFTGLAMLLFSLIALLIVMLLVLAASIVLSRALYRSQLLPWIERSIARLNEDLQNAWS